MTTLVLLFLIVGLAIVLPFTTGASLTAYVGAGLIYIGGFLGGIASKLLDISMLAFVAQFNSFIYTPMASAISTVWTAFRDLGNIVIIGALVFIAISMILGLQSFGSRKLVARVLIIAVLINFSLLFTRIIFSGSNFVAAQFYCAMARNLSTASACNGATSVSFSDMLTAANGRDGVGGQLMNRMGISKAIDSGAAKELVEKTVTDAGGGLAGHATAITFAMLVMILMIVAAGVFAAMSYLLLVRTLLFFFLVATSALAFAAYLIPQGEEYWKIWWKSLLKNSIFAPFLMLMLWATFVFSKALVEGLGGSANIAELFTKPLEGSGYLGLLIFALIIGMLIASFLFARSFAKGIAGFNYAQMFAASPLAIGDRWITGPLGRKVLGGLGMWRARGAEANRADAAARAADTRNSFLTRKFAGLEASKYQRKKQSWEKLSERTFEAGQTAQGKALFEFLGGAKGTYGGKVVNEKDRQEGIAKAAAEFGTKAAAVSKEMAEQLRKNAVAEAQTAHNSKTGGFEKGVQDAANATVGTKRLSEHEKDIREAEANRESFQKEIADITRKALTGTLSPADITRRTQLQTAIGAETSKINTTTTAIQSSREALEKAQKALTDHAAQLPGVIEKAGNDADKELDALVGRAAKRAVWWNAPLSNLATGANISNEARAMAVKGLDPKEKDRSWLKKLIGDEVGGVKAKLK